MNPLPGMESTRALSLDFTDIAIDSGGIEHFVWPLERDANLPEIKAFLRGFSTSLILHASDAPEEVRALRILSKWFMLDIGRLHQAALLLAAADQAGIELRPSSRTPFAAALLRRTEPPISLTAALARGAPLPTAAPHLVRRIVREWQWNGPLRLLKSLAGLSDAVAVEPQALTITHARATGVTLQYAHMRDWFPPANFDPARTPPSSTVFANRLAEVARDCLRHGQRFLDPLLADYIRRWVGAAWSFVDAFNPDRRAVRPIPTELWVGPCSTTIWMRFLCSVVRERGGQVVAHDHGFGDNHCDQHPQHLIEFNGCDRFVTYSWPGARAKAAGIDEALLCGLRAPKVEAVGPEPPALAPRQSTVSTPLRRILYISTFFTFEQPKFTSYVHAYPYLDFQARLLGWLRDKGVDVAYKPHPGDSFQPVPAFRSVLGCDVIEGQFEAIADTFDAYFVDFVGSSLTRPLLARGKPVAYLDLGFSALTDHAQMLLDQRCERIRTWEDTNHRQQFDTAALQNFLQRKHFAFDDAFEQEFYGAA